MGGMAGSVPVASTTARWAGESAVADRDRSGGDEAAIAAHERAALVLGAFNRDPIAQASVASSRRHRRKSRPKADRRGDLPHPRASTATNDHLNRRTA